MMLSTPFKLMAISIAIAGSGFHLCWARDTVAITIPVRGQFTPVQRLNREGVEAVKKRQFDKAESLFYKAYLYDPADPFTLNNLGYIAELKGQIDRAQKFYALASQQGSNANIDLSNVKRLEGQPMLIALGTLQDLPMRVNRMNVDAMRLLSEDRGFEAIALLRKTLQLDPRNPFTLNNFGVAEESIGDNASALNYYRMASNSHSEDVVAVTADQSWSGKPVSDMAAANAARLEGQQQKAGLNASQAAEFNLKGVLAANQNDWGTAKQDFMHAYSLDPSNAFSLNNRGYVAEMDGDLESAEFFYDKAQKAADSNSRVGLASRPIAEGTSLQVVALSSNSKVDSALEKYSQQRRRETGPIELTPRGSAGAGNSTVTPGQRVTPSAPPAAHPPSASQLPK